MKAWTAGRTEVVVVRDARQAAKDISTVALLGGLIVVVGGLRSMMPDEELPRGL